MDKHKSVFDQKAIKHFYSDVLHHLLPNGRHQSIGFFGSPAVTRASDVRIDLAHSNEINVGSPYFYDKPYKFIHYTTIPTLINILRTKKLRLYNLNGMDDRLEFTVPFQHGKKSISEYEIKQIKKKIFTLSMCETYLEDKRQSLSAWREYGDDGKGVGIVLSFNEMYKKDWVFFMLSKVLYDGTSHRKFLALEKLYEEFKIKFNLQINNFDSILYKYYAFHKHSMYKPEKEIRLLYCQRLSDLDEHPCHYDVNRKNEKTTFVELELEWDWDSKVRESIIKQGITPKMVKPVISIDKIIFGYRLSKNSKYEIVEVIQKLTTNYKMKPGTIDSKLKAQF